MRLWEQVPVSNKVLNDLLCRGAGWTPHSMTSYQERLSTYMDALLRTQTMDNEERGVPKSLFSSADRLELSREESSKLGAEMGTLLQVCDPTLHEVALML